MLIILKRSLLRYVKKVASLPRANDIPFKLRSLIEDRYCLYGAIALANSSISANSAAEPDDAVTVIR